jgi:NitT/TauT family transport system substrate-binding protein
LVTRLPEIQSPEDWRGKTIATPQLGNTQDVDCRAWLIHHGIRVTLVGGDARVIPTPNAEMMDLFRSGKIDGAWTVEPWVSRLILDGGGRIFKEEPEEPTTVLAVREDYLAAQPEMVKRFVAAHRELTEWIVQNPEEAKRRVKEELEAITRSKMNPAVIDAAWTRMHFDSSISAEPFEIFLAKARAVGFLRAEFSLKNLVVDLP